MRDNGKLDFSETTFYSDSINDLPLLESVEKPIAVNPDDRLREVSVLRGWEIVDLT
jgi:phosphoserine phosphatase